MNLIENKILPKPDFISKRKRKKYKTRARKNKKHISILYFFISFLILCNLYLVINVNKLSTKNQYVIKSNPTITKEISTLQITIEEHLNEIQRNLKAIKDKTSMKHKLLTDEEIKIISVQLTFGEIFYGIPHMKMIALIASESFYNKKAISKKGAYGLSQLLKETYFDMCNYLDEKPKSIYDVRQNVRCGIRFASRCIFILEKGTSIYEGVGRKPTDEELLMAYNAGPGVVLREKWYKNKEQIYKETKEYIEKWKFYYTNYQHGIYDVWHRYPDRRFNTIKNENIQTNLLQRSN